MKLRYLFLSLIMGLVACNNHTKTTPIARPAFSADSAYLYIAQQVQMGPRVPDSKAHTECVIYLVEQLRRFGAEVTLQQGRMTNYAGLPQQVFNVVGHFPADSLRESILLCAHYDSRPWCDQEEEYDLRFQGVPAANDGASGVGVLLEIARQIQALQQQGKPLRTPIDIVFFDCEDMGTPDFYTGLQREDTWCLGSQLWANEYAFGDNKPVSDKYAFGILLDMVGAPNATFPREYFSIQYAQQYVDLIWHKAAKLGYSSYFVSANAYPITDDHYYVSSITGIPCVDIINYDATNNTGFPFWWHTTMDNMNQINRSTLQAVGETVLSCLN